MSASGERRVIRTCPICESTCGLELTMSGRTVLRTRGDRADPFSRGFMCPKGAVLGEMLDDPDWLTRPMVRVGGRLRTVDWEEALGRAGELLRPIVADTGPASTAVYIGNAAGHSLDCMLYLRTVVKALRGPRMFSASTLDQRPKELVNAVLFGEHESLAVPDIDRTGFLLLIGANPMDTNGSLATAPGWPRRLEALRGRGGRLVVVDPVRTRTAELADLHLSPRVGSDAMLLLSMVHVLLDEDLVALGRLEPMVEGVDRIRALVEPWRPEEFQQHTGVAAAQVRALTRDLAHAERACVYGRMGTTATEFGSIASWAIELLNILTGNLDRVGGVMFPLPASGSANTRGAREYRPLARGRFASRVRGLPELFGELPTACLAEEIDTPGPGRIRALIQIGGNPAVSAPDAERMDRALAGLDAHIAVDPYLNASTRHADVLLPVPSPLQRPHYDLHFTMWAVRNVANYSPRAVDLDPGQIPEWEVLSRLAAQITGSAHSVEQIDESLARSFAGAVTRDPTSLLYGADAEKLVRALAPRRGPERLLDLILRTGPYGEAFGRRPDGLSLAMLEARPHGVDLGPLRPRLPELLRTPTGRIDLAPPLLVADLERLERARGRPTPPGLVLLGRRALRSNNSWTHNYASLMVGRDRALLRISPEDAAARDIATGQRVVVASGIGQVRAVAEVSDRLPPGVVSLPHGWTRDSLGARMRIAQARPGPNVNRLNDSLAIDVPSGTAVLNGTPVEVRRE